MASRENDRADQPAAEDLGGSLADAISAHLDLKKEHGADAEQVELEKQSALGPARRDRPEQQSPAPQSFQTPESDSALSRDEQEAGSEDEAIDPGMTQEYSIFEDDPLEAPPAKIDDDIIQPESTIEFDWQAGEAAAESAPVPEAATPDSGDDVLEQTPDFFEETPEYDRLWFEQKSPKDFDF